MKHNQLLLRSLLLLPLLLSIVPSYTFAQDFVLPSNQRYIAIASRPTIEEARAFAETYRAQFKDTSIFLSKNGWYAISMGKFNYPNDKELLQRLIQDNVVPSDSYFVSGKNFVRIINQLPAEPRLIASPSPGEACVQKAVIGSVGGFISGIIIDCIFTGCENTAVAAVTGVVTGGTKGCIDGVLSR